MHVSWLVSFEYSIKASDQFRQNLCKVMTIIDILPCKTTVSVIVPHTYCVIKSELNEAVTNNLHTRL